MTDVRPRPGRLLRITPRQGGALAVVWLFLALFFGALYRFADATEHHAYNANSTPPGVVTLTQGKKYQLSTKDGQPGLAARGEQIATANCLWQTGTTTQQPLGITGLGADSGAIHVVATFIAPASGPVQILCSGLGPVFIDDADDSTPDLALAFVVLASGLAAVGVSLGIWALYQGSTASRAADEPVDN